MTGRIGEVIILKGGPSVMGEILVPEFELQTKYGPLRFKKSEMLAIEYRNPPFALQDEVQVDAGTRLPGDLKPDVIPVKLESNGQTISIPKSDIHSIVFFTSDHTASATTLDALKGAMARS